jgi:hypothetical protein
MSRLRGLMSNAVPTISIEADVVASAGSPPLTDQLT